MVDLCPQNLRSVGQLMGLSMKTRFSTDPIGKYTGICCSSPIRGFAGLILFDLSRSGKIWPDSFEIWPDLFEICPDLIEIHQDLFKIWSDLTETSRFRQNPAMIRTFRRWPKPEQKLMISNHPNCCLQLVGGGSKYERPKVIGSVLGWV